MTLESPAFIEKLPPSVRRLAPAGAFAGGVVFDIVTLGRVVKPSDLVMLAGYFAGAVAVMVMLGRDARPRGAEHMPFLLQFLLGGLFSATAVLYFKSSGTATGYLFVVVVTLLLVINELRPRELERMTLLWAMFCFCGTMYLNFALPHLADSVHPAWFYLSSLACLGLVVGLKQLSHAREGSVVPAAGVTVVLMLLFLLRVLPPVPLVLKDQMVCRNFSRGAGFACEIEAGGVFEPFKRSEDPFRRAPGERVWALSSVFAPAGVDLSVAHHWFSYDEAEGTWVARDVIDFEIRGGREDGYRVYSYKDKVKAGLWRVETRSENGHELGAVEFEIVPREKSEKLTLEPVSLR